MSKKAPSSCGMDTSSDLFLVPKKNIIEFLDIALCVRGCTRVAPAARRGASAELRQARPSQESPAAHCGSTSKTAQRHEKKKLRTGSWRRVGRRAVLGQAAARPCEVPYTTSKSRIRLNLLSRDPLTQPPAFDPSATQGTQPNTFQSKRFGISFEEWFRALSWHVATRKSVRGAAAPRERSNSWHQHFCSTGAVRARHALDFSFTDQRCFDGIIMIAEGFGT